ncbi:hypothetical protein [Phytohabitans kaempferiae]|uniref:Uncharacterized protein n=1 Tax=Phytohabitans kaempferiae TaxID=1620943 RepID=A0ABV6LWK4_9ACTN
MFAVLSLSSVPADAVEVSGNVRVTDRPGAPGEIVQQIESQTGKPLGVLHKVIAIDDGGMGLTADQAAALIEGRDVDGLRVLGVMHGGAELHNTTMADLLDGVVDGWSDPRTRASHLLLVTEDGEIREWCLTMCIGTWAPAWWCTLVRSPQL